MPRKILVTGGAGALGVSLVKALVERGDDVRVIDNCSRGSRENLPKEVHFIKGDVTQVPYVNWAMNGRDCVIHLAAINGTANFYERPYSVLEVGVKGMLNLLDACQRYNVREFLLVSSSEVYQTPPMIPTAEDVPLSIPDVHNPRYSYAGSKIISELLALHCSHLDRVLVARPHNVFGPLFPRGHVIPDLIERILDLKADEPLLVNGMGEDSRAFCYVDDAVSGLLTVLDKGENRGVYHVGDERNEMKVWQLAQYLLGLGGWGAHRYDYTAASPTGSPARRCPDTTRLRGLGWEPKMRLEDGLYETFQWHKQQREAVK
jgi:dTDP-glucose 4,6-dehydratase/UDP-glucose 4-epimerase